MRHWECYVCSSSVSGRLYVPVPLYLRDTVSAANEILGGARYTQ